jgi:UDP:flavonoid glycosyltransferase YjiC (YdhE family)
MALDLSSKNILVAPLNWGLGHATRCIPIIEALQANGFTPIIASDGVALEMLRKEFPHLIALELPSYDIEYAKNGANFKWKMLKSMPRMIDAVLAEKKQVKKWVREYNLTGIISDNRLGVFNKKVYSVFVTHQLNVLSGNTTWFSSKIHQQAIRKFDECWVPDWEEKPNLTGKLGHSKDADFPIKYLGPLSRLTKQKLPKKYDLMIILSGPEPQRGMLEQNLREMVPDYEGEVIFIRGKVESKQKKEQYGHVTYYNFMTTGELQQTFNESQLVLCRSGYTTIMDLARLGKKAFFIPTPGQYEQEYLAKKLQRDGLVPYASQDDFKLSDLIQADIYKGLPQQENAVHWKNLFCLFECE